jgi:hypothetical protein
VALIIDMASSATRTLPPGRGGGSAGAAGTAGIGVGLRGGASRRGRAAANVWRTRWGKVRRDCGGRVSGPM